MNVRNSEFCNKKSKFPKIRTFSEILSWLQNVEKNSGCQTFLGNFTFIGFCTFFESLTYCPKFNSKFRKKNQNNNLKYPKNWYFSNIEKIKYFKFKKKLEIPSVLGNFGKSLIFSPKSWIFQIIYEHDRITSDVVIVLVIV